MALFSMRMQVIKRSAGRSVIAAAAYRSGEKLHDERQDMIHDYSHRTDVPHTELVFPSDAPAWVQGITREEFWNRVDASEKRKDAQTSRELRIMIPRELPVADRISLVREYVDRCFVNKGMVADICYHNKTTSDGRDQPHAHVMLTMRPLTPEGFGPKSRHEWIPDPSGKTLPDGRPMMVESNDASWNSNTYYEHCREDWENLANAALERIGSLERIDRRSLLERGLARLPEPALRLAFHLKELKGVMQERFGQFQAAKHWQAVEKRAKGAFKSELEPSSALRARAETPTVPAPIERAPAKLWQRFNDWIDRQLDRLSVATPTLERGRLEGLPEQRRGQTHPNYPTPDMER